jgi:hypothetical protein
MNIKGYILSFVVGIVYYIFITQIMLVLSEDMPYLDKLHQILVGCIIFGILGLVIANTILKNTSGIKNGVLRTGVNLGSFFLIFYALVCNWNHVDNATKLTLFGMLFGGIIWYSYKYYNDQLLLKQLKIQKLKEKRKLEKQEDTDNDIIN